MTRSRAQTESEEKLAQACQDMVVAAHRRRTLGASDAADVAQDACVRALDIAEPHVLRDPVRYLFRIVRNLVIDRRRSRMRETALSESLATIDYRAKDPVDPERILAGKQDLARVLLAIDSLPPRCREAFTLHRFGELSYAAIARRMGISTSMVEKHIAEAMMRITQALSSEKRKP